MAFSLAATIHPREMLGALREEKPPLCHNSHNLHALIKESGGTIHLRKGSGLRTWPSPQDTSPWAIFQLPPMTYKEVISLEIPFGPVCPGLLEGKVSKRGDDSD